MDDSLSFESFLEGAKKAAHKAMDDHGRGEYDEFALHAGVAIERLAKAVLVSKNPIYIVEMRGSAESSSISAGTAQQVRSERSELSRRSADSGRSAFCRSIASWIS